MTNFIGDFMMKNDKELKLNGWLALCWAICKNATCRRYRHTPRWYHGVYQLPLKSLCSTLVTIPLENQMETRFC